MTLTKKYKIKESFLWAIQDQSIQKRFLVTLFSLVALRLFYFIPLPGIRSEVFKLILPIHSAADFFYSFLFLIPALQNFSIFSLGIVPFLKACILIQIVMSPFRNAKKNRKALAPFIYGLGFLLSLGSAYSIAFSLEKNELVNAPLILTILVLIGGYGFLLGCAHIIQKYGLGNGFAVVFISSFSLSIFTIPPHYTDIYGPPWFFLEATFLMAYIAIPILLTIYQEKLNIPVLRFFFLICALLLLVPLRPIHSKAFVFFLIWRPMIVVSFILELFNQIAFFREKSNSGKIAWTLYETTLDLTEAELKRHELEQRGIPVLIQPLKFTWGLPIKTFADQYRIYVPLDKKEEAAPGFQIEKISLPEAF